MVRVRWPIVTVIVFLVGLAGLVALPRLGTTGPGGEEVSAAGAGSSDKPVLREPLDLVPAESLLCWYARPFPDVQESEDQPSPLQTLLNLGSRMSGSALDSEAKLWARGIEAFAQAIRFPHVLVLIDAKAKALPRNPSAKRADKIRLALIVDTAGKNEPFARIIQAAINEQTDSEHAALERRQAGPWPYVALRDRRLPAWCEVAWGEIESCFVLTLGEDVWPQVASVGLGEHPALSRADWVERARARRGREALIEIIVACQAIRDRLDPVVDGRASAFFEAWEAGDIERAHWALGFEGRALYCAAHFVEGGRLVERLYADPGIQDPDLMATIPAGARYAVYRVPPAKVLPRFFKGMLATRSPQEQRRIQERWQQIEVEYGFDADRDILAHLGKHIVMHNDPPHPLHIPLAMTTLTEIADEPEQVRMTIQTLCRAWRDAQREYHQRTGKGEGVVLAEDSDGVWYLKFGPVAGPAWTVTDRYLVTSWSPLALRQYLDKVGTRAGRPLH